ncbi:DNA-formamidopyrimidine glycosylase [Texcoconibacillus texcoconensis]|uniref:Formamidopyrimidine-DNA glycosylase n=1 Tax=Texcoconibacillus texcoconensis TaxID=1095777 RepID=A0A840QMV6_9BACI|nr:DNA-formamidopyrimidine glycosylase [Texcoconibacillus texcoconensis]MBB5172714.1 formamidopyrimidine-DNA glycosylase [Texcoconibacillus texcoconensis]
MPELPEVETVKKTLESLVLGHNIERVTVRWPKMIKRPDDIHEFAQLIEGQTFREVARRGKFLKFHLDDVTIVSHLRMEGRYGVYEASEPFDKHTHVCFHLDGDLDLRYRDVRKFGTMHVFSKGTEEDYRPLSDLGPEPFSDTFTVDAFYQRLQNTKRNIKATLLDQTVVTGLGNIYVDEALFQAGIHPERTASHITKTEVEKLREAIISTLSHAIELGGSSVKSYVNGQGEMGMFQQQLFVYGRASEACKNCETPIEKSVVAGRGTHVCPNCQHK